MISMSGKEIRELRTRLGLSQQKFASLLGVSTGSVVNWELKNIKPTPLAQEKLNNIRQEYECQNKKVEA